MDQQQNTSKWNSFKANCRKYNSNMCVNVMAMETAGRWLHVTPHLIYSIFPHKCPYQQHYRDTKSHHPPPFTHQPFTPIHLLTSRQKQLYRCQTSLIWDRILHSIEYNHMHVGEFILQHHLSGSLSERLIAFESQWLTHAYTNTCTHTTGQKSGFTFKKI